MRILITGDSVSAGEWDNIRDKDTVFKRKVLNSHRGLAQWLAESGHEVYRQSFPGGSNALAVEMLFRDKPAFEQPDVIAENQSSTRMGDFYTGETFEYTEPYRKSFDFIIFFWTGPLRSIVDTTRFDQFFQHYQSEGAITFDMANAWRNLCIQQDLKRLCSDPETKILLVGGQEDLPEYPYPDHVKPVVPSFLELVYPDIKRPDWMDTTYLGWSNSVLRWNKGLVIDNTTYTGSRYEEKLLDVLLNSINFWKEVKKANTTEDAHPDRYCHKLLHDEIVKVI